jgi:hypothetical protein
LTEAVRRIPGLEEHLSKGHLYGWWQDRTRAGKDGAKTQIEFIGLLPEVDPQTVYDRVSDRLQWPLWYASFRLMRHRLEFADDPNKNLMEIMVRTPPALYHLLAIHSNVPERLQVLFRSPNEHEMREPRVAETVKGFRLDPDAKAVFDIDGGHTYALSPNGRGTLFAYHLALRGGLPAAMAVGRAFMETLDIRTIERSTLDGAPAIAKSMAAYVLDPGKAIAATQGIAKHHDNGAVEVVSYGPNQLKVPLDLGIQYKKIDVLE